MFFCLNGHEPPPQSALNTSHTVQLPSRRALLAGQRRLLQHATRASYTNTSRCLVHENWAIKLGEWGKAFCCHENGVPKLGGPTPGARCSFPTGSEPYASPQIVFLSQAVPSMQSKLLLASDLDLDLGNSLPPTTSTYVASQRQRCSRLNSWGGVHSGQDRTDRHLDGTSCTAAGFEYSPFASDVWSLGIMLFVLRAGF